MNQPQQQPQQQQPQKGLTTTFSSFLDKLKPQFELALPKHLNSDRFARLALTVFSTSPALRACEFNSIAASMMTAAQLGLEIGVNGQGWLIPYKTTCTFVPGWKGLVDLVGRSGRATVWTGAVRKGDAFTYKLGASPQCDHMPGDEVDGAFTHVYACGQVKNAALPVIEVWTRKKVENHLKRYNKQGAKHYALKDENNFEMYARKVALLQVLKYMPMSIEVSNAIEASHAAEAGRNVIIDGELVIDPMRDDEQEQQPEETPPPKAAEQKPTAEDCPESKIVQFIGMIEGGRTTIEGAINTLLSKYTLTPEQKKRLEAAVELT